MTLPSNTDMEGRTAVLPSATPRAQWGQGGLAEREGRLSEGLASSFRPSPTAAAPFGKGVTFNAEDRRPPVAPSRLGKSALEDVAPAQHPRSDLASLRSAAPPASLADEEAAMRVKSAVDLLELITPPVYVQYLNLPGQPGSRIPAHAAGDPSARAVARLSDIATCGKTGTKNDDLRRSLNDIARYNDVAGVTGEAHWHPLDA